MNANKYWLLHRFVLLNCFVWLPGCFFSKQCNKMSFNVSSIRFADEAHLHLVHVSNAWLLISLWICISMKINNLRLMGYSIYRTSCQRYRSYMMASCHGTTKVIHIYLCLHQKCLIHFMLIHLLPQKNKKKQNKSWFWFDVAYI